MGATETSFTMIAPLILRNLITSIFIFFHKPISNLTLKYKIFDFFRCLLITSFLFFLRLLPRCFPSDLHDCKSDHLKPPKPGSFRPNHGVAEQSVSRALSQLLSIVSSVPVNSRKYEVVRSLAERLIEENHREGVAALREANRTVLAASFDSNINLLEALMVGEDGSWVGPVDFRVGRILRAVRDFGRIRVGEFREGSEISSEKIAAELLWLAEKIAAYGDCEESCCRWAAAERLARLALSAEPRLQGILVRISAFMFKQAKEMGKEGGGEESEREGGREAKLKLLLSWLPLLCRASNGTDTPVLSSGERLETERALEETIKALKAEEQEQVLSLWLHHFTFSHSSDWPNLHGSYVSWYTASLKLFISH